MSRSHDFATFTDRDLVYWLCQYAGKQSGFYRDSRRARVRAEREAARRGLPWQQGQSYDLGQRHGQHAACLRVIDIDAVLARAEDRSDAGDD
jgi:hypothetical protein